MTPDYEALVVALSKLPSESECVEFKTSNSDAKSIGKDISALANSATYHDRHCAYKVWGIDDQTHELIGTDFDPVSAKAVGNQNLLIWLKVHLSDNANYSFENVHHDGKRFVILTVIAATGQPVYFENVAYIRAGSSTTKLTPGSAKETELWRKLQAQDFESQIAMENVTSEEAVDLLDIDLYFDLLGLKRAESLESRLIPLVEQELLIPQDDGLLSISNLGALLIARKMSDFTGLRKRVVRVVRHAGKMNAEIVDDRFLDKGYARAIPEAVDLIASMIAADEILDGAFRRIRYAYPLVAVRELLSNIVIHQDLADSGSGPVVGIFSNRIEFGNPGGSLIPIDRMLNAQPKTRNPMLANLLRQMDLCEEDGPGMDLAVAACEEAHMAAPRVESSDQLGTRVTLFSGIGYDRMTKRDKLDAMYWHACLLYAQGDSMSNHSLRERFGLEDDQKNTVAISRLIKQGCEQGRIKVEDESVGAKFRRYVPHWA